MRVNKPVSIVTLVTAIVNVAVVFGFGLSPEQTVALISVTSLAAAAVAGGVTWSTAEVEAVAKGDEEFSPKVKDIYTANR